MIEKGSRFRRLFTVVLPLTMTLMVSVVGRAQVLTITPNQQQQDEWCWDACSQTALEYYGVSANQCEIANYAFGQTTCCNNVVWPDGSGPSCDQGNWLGSLFSWLDLFTGIKSSGSVLQQFGQVDTAYRPWAVDLPTLQTQIELKRPWIMGWKWTTEGGHALLGYGLSDTMVSYMDPWPGNPRLNIADYSVVKQASDHTWVNTLLMNVKGITFVIDDTGSMGDKIDNAKAAADQIVDRNTATGKHFLYTLFTFKDGDAVLRGQTLDPTEIKSLIDSLYASGGGYCPESSLTAAREAAAYVPNSEIYLMTDADSNSYGVDDTFATIGEVLYTAYVLAANGVTMNSIIYGDCSTPSVVSSLVAPSQQQQCSTVRKIRPKSESSSTTAIDSGMGGFQYLSQVSGGLYFQIAPEDTSTATEMILTHATMNTTVAEYDGNSPATYDIPVDSTISSLQILLKPLSGSMNSLEVIDPTGTPVSDGTSGVSVSTLGSITAYVITPPALMTGKWKAAVSGAGTYRLAATGSTTNPLDYLGGTSVGVGGTLAMQAALVAGEPSISFALSSADGSSTLPATLYDDGLHGDGHANDFFYAGTLLMNTVGTYRFKVAADGFFQRMHPTVITVGEVEVVAPTPAHVLAGTASSATFQIKNLGASQDTYNLYASSSLQWDDLSALPSTVTVPPGSVAQVIFAVNVPAGTAPGQTDVLSLEAVSQTNPLINNTGATRTIAGPDVTPPYVSLLLPQPNSAIQGKIELTAMASDDVGVGQVYFFVRAAGGSSGTPIGYENLKGVQEASGNWEYPFDTTLVPDGDYIFLAEAVDTGGNAAWSSVVADIKNWTTTPVAGKLKISPTKLDFGTVTVNKPKIKKVKVTNTGKISKKRHPLAILVEMESETGTPPPSPFSISTPCSDVELQPSGKGVPKKETFCEVAVQFEPTQAVSYKGTLTISDNLAPKEMQTVKLSGKGKAAK